jgi:hypothetical protein
MNQSAFKNETPVQPWEIEFYPSASRYDFTKNPKLQPYTGRVVPFEETRIGFLVNKEGFVVPTTCRILYSTDNVLKNQTNEEFYHFGSVSLKDLDDSGVHNPDDLLAFAGQISAMVQGDKEKYLKPNGIETLMLEKPVLQQVSVA